MMMLIAGATIMLVGVITGYICGLAKSLTKADE